MIANYLNLDGATVENLGAAYKRLQFKVVYKMRISANESRHISILIIDV